MIRQNRAVPILLVLTFAFILYLAGCFGSEQTSTAAEDTQTPVVTPTTPAIVDPDLNIPESNEEPFYHTIQTGDTLPVIASTYNVPVDVIIRANPQVTDGYILAGDELLIPGASTDNTVLENEGPDRADGITVTYVVESGDNLGLIASQWTVTLEALVEANPDVDANSLQVNQLLVIPPWGSGYAPGELAPRTTPVASTRQPGDPALEHTVEAGQFISLIAELYNVTVNQIVDANDLEAGGNNIQINQVLLIPPPKEPTAEPG